MDEDLEVVEAVRWGNWKAIHDNSHGMALYDLTSDPGEESDVASANPDVVRKIEEIIDEAHMTRGEVYTTGTCYISTPPYFVQGSKTQTTLENYGPLITAGIYLLHDDDWDPFTISLAGADADRFSKFEVPLHGNLPFGINTAIALDFNGTPDYESPADANSDGVYEVTIVASYFNGTTELDVTLTILDVDEAPVITGPAAVSFPENSDTVVGQYTAADPEGKPVTLTLGGRDEASFTFADGTLTFNDAPDYETKNSYSLAFSAEDGTNTARLGVTITITDVDETRG